MNKGLITCLALLGLGAALMAPVGGRPGSATTPASRPTPMDLSAFPTTRPDTSRRLLFIHHSCGGQLLGAPAEQEDERGARCLYLSHPNGGGLRAKLEEQGYEVHEASYGSEIGENTDAFDWVPKFRDKMDKVLTVDENDRFFTDGRRHQIVVFKSCYTETRFAGVGAAPGNAAGPDKTLWNYKAHMTALLGEMKKHPEILFVYLTPPPQSSVISKERLFRFITNELRGRPHPWQAKAAQAEIARAYATWIASTDGWLAGYPLKNVAVFDYFDLLTDHGASNLSRYSAPDGDNHPLRAGNEKAAAAFVPFLNRAVRRHAAGLSAAPATPPPI